MPAAAAAATAVTRRCRAHLVRARGIRLCGAGTMATTMTSEKLARCRGSFAPRHGKAVEPEGREATTVAATSTEREAAARAAANKAVAAQESLLAMAGVPQSVPLSPPSTAQAQAQQMDAADVTTTTTTPTKGVDAQAGGGGGGGGGASGSSDETTSTSFEASEDSASSSSDATTPTSTRTTPTPNSSSSSNTSATTPPTPAKPARSLDAALLMDSPSRAPPHHPPMAPPPYVHHFDSYSLVKQLRGGGYAPEQATTAMKGIRTLLAQHLDVAQQSLVSKSDVENETYLFTAACSELSTELRNNRRLQDEQMRQQRTLLQHEVDILTQSLNQELLTLNDNVRGMFNDRRMVVREEQKGVESAIQKIAYKMSIDLSSDCKSEIEGVRWILIRRSVLGIIFMAILTLGMLRYATYAGHQRTLEAERRRREHEELRRDGGKTDHSSPADAAAILAAS